MDERIWVALVIILLGGIPFAVLLPPAWRGARSVLAMRSWQPTHGRVISAVVREQVVRVPVKTSASRYRSAVRYGPAVTYQYQVGGVVYEGSAVDSFELALLSSEPSDVVKFLKRYPPGQPVVVFYNPVNPAEAVLNPRIGLALAVVCVLEIALILLTAGMVWVAFR